MRRATRGITGIAVGGVAKVGILGRIGSMSVKQLEEQVTQLSEVEFKEFSIWFEGYQADVWDRQIEKDVLSGRFDGLFAEIEGEVGRGEIKPL
jgi:hypothetical protein